ncbi:MAG TPA: dihydrofolate reductase family protein [Candidatus Deferrimicrobium sp.]|nr:dihydrofolate reductase family protein [Candidatus Deferrimicrobium sp.]
MQRRPFVLVNMAVTADGKIDTVERLGARISGAADTARVDRLRAESDAIMVGGRTLLAEDPRLTVRDAGRSSARVREGRPAQPVKVAAATRIGRPGGTEPSLPWPSRFLSDGGGPVLVATTPQTRPATLGWLKERGAEVIVHDAPRVDLARLLGELDERGIERLMVEGGSTLVAALLEGGLVDELQLAMAPLLFGGDTAPTPVGGPGWPLAQAVRLSLLGTAVDDDGVVILRYQVSRGDAL